VVAIKFPSLSREFKQESSDPEAGCGQPSGSFGSTQFVLSDQPPGDHEMARTTLISFALTPQSA